MSIFQKLRGTSSKAGSGLSPKAPILTEEGLDSNKVARDVLKNCPGFNESALSVLASEQELQIKELKGNDSTRAHLESAIKEARRAIAHAHLQVLIADENLMAYCKALHTDHPLQRKPGELNVALVQYRKAITSIKLLPLIKWYDHLLSRRGIDKDLPSIEDEGKRDAAIAMEMNTGSREVVSATENWTLSDSLKDFRPKR